MLKTKNCRLSIDYDQFKVKIVDALDKPEKINWNGNYLNEARAQCNKELRDETSKLKKCTTVIPCITNNNNNNSDNVIKEPVLDRKPVVDKPPVAGKDSVRNEVVRIDSNEKRDPIKSHDKKEPITDKKRKVPKSIMKTSHSTEKGSETDKTNSKITTTNSNQNSNRREKSESDNAPKSKSKVTSDKPDGTQSPHKVVSGVSHGTNNTSNISVSTNYLLDHLTMKIDKTPKTIIKKVLWYLLVSFIRLLLWWRVTVYVNKRLKLDIPITIKYFVFIWCMKKKKARERKLELEKQLMEDKEATEVEKTKSEKSEEIESEESRGALFYYRHNQNMSTNNSWHGQVYPQSSKKLIATLFPQREPETISTEQTEKPNETNNIKPQIKSIRDFKDELLSHLGRKGKPYHLSDLKLTPQELADMEKILKEIDLKDEETWIFRELDTINSEIKGASFNNTENKENVTDSPMLSENDDNDDGEKTSVENKVVRKRSSSNETLVEDKSKKRKVSEKQTEKSASNIKSTVNSDTVREIETTKTPTTHKSWLLIKCGGQLQKSKSEKQDMFNEPSDLENGNYAPYDNKVNNGGLVENPVTVNTLLTEATNTFDYNESGMKRRKLLKMNV
ncbi:hypothetical protein SNEBB_009314 [Seison nebaliae]|nr:hypothetical protein SNEBB_009314 [Seison nebaliae]